MPMRPLAGIDGGAGFDLSITMARSWLHSSATAPSVSAAVAVTGAAAAVSTATATSTATAIDAGGGVEADVVSNLNKGTVGHAGKLTARAETLAATANVAVTNQGLAIAADAVWDGGTKADATAKGIDVGLGADTVTNEGEIEAISDATAASVAVSVAVTGVAGASATSTATSKATAIDGGYGQDVDTVTNKGKLMATANALAAAASVSVTNTGVAISADSVWDGGTKSEAIAKGIDVGNGADTVSNEGEIEATADADAGSAAVSVAVSGVAGGSATSTAKSFATAIDTGDGHDADTVTNKGKLTAKSDSLAGSVSVGFTNGGIAVAADSVWDGGTKAEATSRGIDSGAGADTIDNQGAIEADARARTASVGVSVAVSGVAGAVTSATAQADAAAIDSGAGDDTITNRVALKSTADAEAGGVSVSVTNAGLVVAGNAAWDGGIRSGADARGIDAGAGQDGIVNDGLIETRAEATTPNVAISVAVSGVAGSVSTSTATADAVGINTASDDLTDAGDAVENNARIDVDADATAVAVQLTGTLAGGAVAMDGIWDGGTTADADAAGIRAGHFNDVVVNHGELDVVADADAPSISGAFALEGVAGAIAAATARSDAAGIDAGAGNDTISNTGKITATTNASAVTVSAAVTKFGVSVAGNNAWDGGASSEARSKGIDGGAGLDTIVNAGEIKAESKATSPTVSVGFTVAGVSAAVSTATAKADSTAIDGGDSNDTIDNQNTGKLTSIADANGVAVNVGLTGAGAAVAADSVWDGGTSSTATAKGIDGGQGRDQIANAATIDATATSTTVSNNNTITVAGVAGATSTANATADATAIDGGADGDDVDVLTNRGAITATSDASATGVSVAVTVAGASVATDSFWDGGTQANATSRGMNGGAGNDRIANHGGLITADATSETHSVSVSATGAILAAASAASTSTATAAAVDGGAGNDDITNDYALVSKAKSSAGGTSVSVVLGGGGAVSGSPFDNATQASATATGIAGGDGNDTVQSTETSSISLDSSALAKDTTVSVGVNGFSGTRSGSQAIARGTGIDGGDGHDTLDNRGAITGVVTAEAKARAISITALAGASIGDASTTADAGVTGIAGGAGNDHITNDGAITLTPHAQATGQSVSVSQQGVAIGDAGATATSGATGIDGGEGNNHIVNRGVITGTATAGGTARSIGVTGVGFTLNKANTTVTTGVAGIRGGGNNDSVSNENIIDVSAASTATATSVSVSVGGVSDASARTLPEATAVGIDGDGGNDAIANAGDITVNATSGSTATGSSWTVAGVSKSDTGTTATTTAIGIAGGDGNDLVQNQAAIGVHAGSSVSVSGGGFTFAGTGKSTSELTATTHATGISGGDGDDDLRSAGAIIVDAVSALTSTGGKHRPPGPVGCRRRHRRHHHGGGYRRRRGRRLHHELRHDRRDGGFDRHAGQFDFHFRRGRCDRRHAGCDQYRDRHFRRRRFRRHTQ